MELVEFVENVSDDDLASIFADIVSQMAQDVSQFSFCLINLTWIG